MRTEHQACRELIAKKKSVYKEDWFEGDRELLKAPQLVTIYTNSVAIGSQKPGIDLN